MIGAHIIKQGLSRYLVDLIERGWITHLATNGAGIIHDLELAYQGGWVAQATRYCARFVVSSPARSPDCTPVINPPCPIL